jgi:hypothetical protein
MKSIAILLTQLVAAAALIAASGCATTRQARPEPPTPDQIVQLAQEGKSADDIIKLLKDSYAVYELPASKLADLRQRGVPDKVIDYMQATYVDYARREEALRGPYYYDHWGYWGHPHPRHYRRHWPRAPYWHPYWW